MRLRTRNVALLFASLALAPRPASAQVPPPEAGFALDRFRPAERGSEWFALDTLDMRGHLRPSFGVVGSYSYRALAAYGPADTVLFSPVEHQVILHAGASLRLWDTLRLGLDVPLALAGDGVGGALLNGARIAPASSGGVGDVRLAADVRLVGAYRDPFTLAIGAQAFLPSGDRAQYLSDGTVRGLPRVQVAGDIGRFVYAGYAGVMLRSARQFGGYDIGTDFVFGASAGVRLLDKGQLVIGPEIYGGSIVTASPVIQQTPVEGLLGGHLTVADEWRFGLAGGLGLTRAFGTPSARALLNLEWTPGIAEPVPPPREPPPEPPPAVIPAPLPAPPADRDGDGIVDAEDACIDVKGIKTDDPKTNGCPPPPADRDKDGIEDAKDACPDEPGPANVVPAKHGCPMAVVQGNAIKIMGEVKFATNSAVILPEGDEILNGVLGILQKRDDIKHVTVEGHTDNRGGAALNRKLSQARAASVVKWLTDKGIAKERLEPKGFGPDAPIADNGTDEGRALNRRVAFRIDP